jgi:hypothetical protein
MLQNNMRKWWGFAFFMLVLSAGSAARSEETESPTVAVQKAYLSELIHRAYQKKLSRQRYWHLLLHYQKDFFGGYTSLADGPGFFMATHGKTSPQAELEATLEKFFSDEPVGASQQQAQCAFPARYRWLKEQLEFDPERLPERVCERFRTWTGTLDPQSATLIFPSAYMNNPSSMFGHTLIRIDQKGQTEETRILAYVINYAADVTTDNGIIFAIFGVTGGFRGYFSIMPYYLKVREYSDMENRDIWEYKLNFGEEQIERMLMHAWELGNTYFDYYFFTENCSYHLLSLLEIADPSLHLTEGSRSWIIPADTVRWVAEQPGLVSEVVYRPSRSTEIRRKWERMAKDERGWLKRIYNDPEALRQERFAGLHLSSQALVLDVTSDYLRYLEVSDDEKRETYSQRKQTVLEARSALKVRSEAIDIAPLTSPPEKGHKTARAGIGFGWRGGEPFEEIHLRAAYHDLLDDEIGYTSDAQIEIMSGSLRHYNHRNRTRLDELTLAGIISLSPMDSLFKKPSWKVSTGFNTIEADECDHCSYFNINTGVGVALQARLIRHEVLYAFTELDLNYGNVFEKDYRAGGGGTAGLLMDIARWWKIHLFTTYLSFPLGDRSHEFRSSFQQRLTLAKDLALRLELNRRHRQNEGLLRLDLYF